MTMAIKVCRYVGRTRGRYPAFPPYGNEIGSTYAKGYTVCSVLYHRYRAKTINATAKRNARGRKPINGRLARRSRKVARLAA